MTDQPPLAEQNQAPFIFVSYAHEDESRIQDDIAHLKDVAETVWLDENIGAGTPWREEIAEAIERCDVFLFFVSPSSIASEHCRRELNYALETRRRVIAVHLEATELSPGQKMSLMDRQAILRYQLTPEQYRAKLTSGVLNSPLPDSPGPTSRQRRVSRVRRTLIYAAFPALLIIIGWGLAQLNFDPPHSEDTQAAPVGDNFALAIMPFQAISGEQAVADGFHADVLDQLTKLPGVLIISIDSLNEMQRRDASISEIARTLNVSHVIQGDLQQVGEKLKINLKMVDGGKRRRGLERAL